MKKLLIMILSVLLLCACLAGCRPAGEAGECEDTATTGREVTLPEFSVPSKPDADYHLPPCEKPGSGNVQTH